LVEVRVDERAQLGPVVCGERSQQQRPELIVERGVVESEGLVGQGSVLEETAACSKPSFGPRYGTPRAFV
jgi:hypothetical protein